MHKGTGRHGPRWVKRQNYGKRPCPSPPYPFAIPAFLFSLILVSPHTDLITRNFLQSHTSASQGKNYCSPYQFMNTDGEKNYGKFWKLSVTVPNKDLLPKKILLFFLYTAHCSTLHPQTYRQVCVIVKKCIHFGSTPKSEVCNRLTLFLDKIVIELTDYFLLMWDNHPMLCGLAWKGLSYKNKNES